MAVVALKDVAREPSGRAQLAPSKSENGHFCAGVSRMRSSGVLGLGKAFWQTGQRIRLRGFGCEAFRRRMKTCVRPWVPQDRKRADAPSCDASWTGLPQ